MNRAINASLFLILANASTGYAAPACTSAATGLLNGWGWENNASCQVVGNATTTTTTTTVVTTTTNSDSNCVDSDGDGWGWNNITRMSCRTTQTQPPEIITPVVANGCVDTPPLNDGWGWNPTLRESCRIGQTPPPPPPPGSGVCEDSLPVGDGYGWNSTTRMSCEIPIVPAINRPPSTPSNLSYNIDQFCLCGVELVWTASTDSDGDSIRYEIYADNALVNTTSSTSYSDYDLIPGNSYDYRVRAIDSRNLASGSRSVRINVPNFPDTGPGPITINPSNTRLPTTVEIPYVPGTVPTIDGVVDLVTEWAGAVSSDRDGNATFIDNLLVRTRAGFDDYGPSSRWYAKHDGTYLYLLIENTEDRTLAEEQNDSSGYYQDDSIELFLDGDGSRTNSYDGYDDYQLILKHKKTTERWGSRSLRNLDFEYDTNYWTHATGAGVSEAYYEIAIDMISANIYSYREFGIEVQINEDDDGGDRDAKWGWAGRTGEDRAPESPRAFGRAIVVY